MREQFELLSRELAQAYQDVDKKLAMAEIAEAVQKVCRDRL